MKNRRACKINKLLIKKGTLSFTSSKVAGPIRPSIESITRTVQEAIKKIHDAGLPTTHSDKRGRYRLFPDGRKKYIGDE